MEQVLKEHGTPMTASAIAYEINKQHLYERGDKLPVPSSQIHARAKNYQQLFTKTSAGEIALTCKHYNNPYYTESVINIDCQSESLTDNTLHNGSDMKSGCIEQLKEAGFKGFVPVSVLKTTGIYSKDGAADRELDKAGVYMVVRDTTGAPSFREIGTGGHFKGKNPNVPIRELENEWVDGETVIYIGKAGGQKSNATLRKRLKQYIRFGSGEAVGHWGGRYIWQLEDADQLLFCWKAYADAEQLEKALIATFKECHDGKRPFANLKD